MTLMILSAIKRIVVKSLGELTRLTPEAFWDDEEEEWYFPEKNKVGCLTSIDLEARRDECQVTCMADPSAALMYLLLDQGHYGHTEAVIDDQQIDLSAKRFDGLWGFFVALQNGHSEAVKDFMQKVLTRGDLSAAQKEELLAASRANGPPGLFMALQIGHSETVKVFLMEVLASDLPNKIKERLLAAKDKCDRSGLIMAHKNGHSETVKAFKECVLASKLSEEIKQRLVPQEVRTV